MLVVLTDGVAGGAQILAGGRDLDVFQDEKRNSSVAANHDVSIQTLKKTDRNYSHLKGLSSLVEMNLCLVVKVFNKNTPDVSRG